MEYKKLKVALFVGGTSSEREVSKMTSKCVYDVLLNIDCNVRVFDPALGKNQLTNFEDFFKEDNNLVKSDRNYLELINSDLLDDLDIVFLGLHGTNGEDGKIQALLDLRGIKYTGSKVLASALAMDKAMSKSIFRDHNVLTADWLHVSQKNFNSNLFVEKVRVELGFPCVVKPNDGGSTIGLSVCESEECLNDAASLAFKYCEKVIVEEFIKGRELTVGIIGEQIFPVLEIKPKHSLYDYECKYSDGMSEYQVPADISIENSDVIKKAAYNAYKSLGCEGYGRVDFILDNNNNAYCLEVNTLPGLTTHSLLPKVAAAEGVSFEEVIKLIIKEAL